MMKVYYAHCLTIFNRPQEARDVATLEALGFEVVNPNSAECEAGYKASGMEFFRKFTEECGAIAF